MGSRGRKRKYRDSVFLAIRSSSRRGSDWVIVVGDGGGKMDVWRGRKSLVLKI